MKIRTKLFYTIIINMVAISSLYSQIRGTVQDIDGNVYQTITIGTQVWMAENLQTTRYNDGTIIPNITGKKAWRANSTDACCYYKNNLSNKARFGTLYNWYTVSSVNSKNVCPSGWHVPTDAEWTKLTSSLAGGIELTSVKLKETGTPSSGGSLDGAIGAGEVPIPVRTRIQNGTDYSFDSFGYWWSSSEFDTDLAWGWERFKGANNGTQNKMNKLRGQNVRCVKDNTD